MLDIPPLPSLAIVVALDDSLSLLTELAERLFGESCFNNSEGSFCFWQSGTIHTKYYNAKVRMIGTRLSDLDNGLVKGLFGECGGCEGLILVADSSPESLNALSERNWTDTPPFPREDEESVRLFLELGCHAFSDAVQEWAVENGFEHISINSPEPHLGQDVVETGLLADNQQGWTRVVEALQCHMWSNMEMRRNCSIAQGSENAVVGPAIFPPTRENQCQDQNENIRVEAVYKSIEDAEAADLSLERAFEQVLDFKARQTNLSNNARKEQAAKLAMTLALVMGADDSDVETSSEGSCPE
eukprot:GHVN01002016.1.p1 GENE.GHVN01002016.1~~GHVN01002016.1.p1  ORF type:complete len:300 (+),score=28.11 GHVN01002016.1:1827-2726(+)